MPRRIQSKVDMITITRCTFAVILVAWTTTNAFVTVPGGGARISAHHHRALLPSPPAEGTNWQSSKTTSNSQRRRSLQLRWDDPARLSPLHYLLPYDTAETELLINAGPFRSSLSNVIQRNKQKLAQNRFAVFSGMGLAFNSGYINGCCLSGILGQSGAVSAFTGAYTMAGLAVGAGDYAAFASIVKLIFSFVVGAAVFGMINPNPQPNRISTRYGPTFLLASVLMGLSGLTANMYPHRRTFLYLAAMANGLQNAATSAYSQNLVRTSHMSGITSDMGMLLGQMLRGNMTNAWRFVILVGLASCFMFGGVVSYSAATKFKSMAFVFSSGLYFMIALSVVGFTSYQKQISIWRAATGARERHHRRPMKAVELEHLNDEHSTSLKVVNGSSMIGNLTQSEFIIRKAGANNTSEIWLEGCFS